MIEQLCQETTEILDLLYDAVQDGNIPLAREQVAALRNMAERFSLACSRKFPGEVF